jgi:hypothetical protein
MGEIAVVIDHMPSEPESKALAEVGFTNIMVDPEKKLLDKAMETDTQAPYLRVAQRMPSKDELQALVAAGVTRVIYAPPVPPAGKVTPMDPALADEPTKDLSELPALPAAKENVTPITEAKQQKANKIQMKRFQVYLERRKRAINKGIPEEKVDQYLREEDYRNMPVAEKVQRLEGIMSSTFQGFSQDIIHLRQNDGHIADAFDINNRAVFKMLEKLGLTPEQQKELMKEAADEHEADKKAKIEARKKAEELAKQAQLEAQKKASEAKEKANIVQETKDEKHPEPQGAEPPAEATQFGG